MTLASKADRSRIRCGGRPAFATAELAAVAGAFSAMPAGLSARRRAALLAQRVAAELRAIDRRRNDPMLAALEDLRACSAADPVDVLVRSPEFGAEAMLARSRLGRFEARGCRQLLGEAWQAETRELIAAIEARLAERFRRCVKILGVN